MQLTVLRRKEEGIDAEQLTKALNYIDGYWSQLRKTQKTDTATLIGLPNEYLVPSAVITDNFIFEEQYYWDSFFMALGMTDPSHQPVIEGMLENLLYLFKRFGIIPNASRMYSTSRSQPPLLTSYIFHVYDTYYKEDKWLEERIEIAKQEYWNVWLMSRHPQWHKVHNGLSRYYDINVLHDLAEAESGWDMTPRFERKCLDYLPIDLNSLLFKYETDFARAASIRGDEGEEKLWQSRASTRQSVVQNLMWSKFRGFFFDYNYQRGVRGSVWSLAGYYSMWVGLASKEQARRMVASLDKFEFKGGLATTTRPVIDMSIFGSLKTQWAYPNGWAPLHYIVIEGLHRYGYEQQARQIAIKWVKTNLNWFIVHGEFVEKYNVVNPTKKSLEGVYPSQTGFGWTNAVFAYLVKKYNLTEN